MPDFAAWLNWNEAGDFEEWYREANRADSVAFMQGHRGIDITLMRGATALNEQRALLVPAGRSTTAGEAREDSGQAAREQLVLVGQPDMDIARGDRFKYPATLERLNYEIIRVERSLYGMVQAYAEEMQ